MPGDRSPIKRAVIADDDEFFRLALAAILSKRLGFAEVIETASLDEALARLGDHEGDGSIALALFDLEMPGMAGAASLSAVRECFPDVRVAIVSASARRQDILLALDAGAHGYVVKGSSTLDLSNALAMIMDGVIFVPPSLAEVRPRAAAFVGSADATTIEPCADRSSVDADVLQLTRRQQEVLRLIVDGKTNKEIARAMALSEGTVKVHVAALLRGLGVANRSAAAALGARLATKPGI